MRFSWCRNDAAVAAMAALTVPAYLVWCTSDTTAFMGGCTLRGAGKQSVGATISLTSSMKARCVIPTLKNSRALHIDA